MLGEVIPRVPHSGGSAEFFKRFEQPFDPSIRSVNIVLGDVFPNVVKIQVRRERGRTRSCTLFPAVFRLALETSAGLGRINVLAAVERGQTASDFLVELCKLNVARLLVFFQEA